MSEYFAGRLGFGLGRFGWDGPEGCRFCCIKKHGYGRRQASWVEAKQQMGVHPAHLFICIGVYMYSGACSGAYYEAYS